MPASDRKRKGSSRPTTSVGDDQQREKKRLQNRISQQCFREKQATYIRHLEQFVNSIEKADGFSSSDAAENLRLIRENHGLRESLLQMRKKLLSLSAQAASMAKTGDDIIDQEPDSHDGGSQQSPDTECPRLDGPGSETTESGESIDGAPTPMPASTQSHLALDGLMNGDSGKGIDLTPIDQVTCDVPPIAHPERQCSTKDTHQESHPDSDNTPRPIDTDISTFFAGDCVKFSPFRGLLICKPPNASTKCPLLLLEAKIQQAMQQFNLFSLHETISIRPFVTDLSKPELQQIDDQILTQIVHLASYALIQGSRVGGYSHVMCPSPVFERVLVWRCNPTSENRNRIELPFRPTVLQQRFPNHHPAIDLLYWSELRDQLILCQEEIEIGTVVYRWQLSSVVEFPEQEAALSVLELFTYLANPTQFTLNGAVDEDGISIPLTDVTARDVTDELKQMIASYRLDQFAERKLPPWMAEEYPFIDMTNSESPSIPRWLSKVIELRLTV